MNFEDILKKDVTKRNIILGHNGNRYLKVDIYENPSIIITGETGTGKSILLDEILLQLFTKYTSLEMNLIAIDTSGVELNYYTQTRYSLINALNDKNKALVVLENVIKEIHHRKDILDKNNCQTALEYNKNNNKKMPLLVVAIDDNDSLLDEPDVDNILKYIITNIKNLNIFIILVTNDVHNDFFINDDNTRASILISFDYASEIESKYANLPDVEDLEIGKFKIKVNDKIYKFSNIEFDDSIIKKVLETK